jgi:hypothetical protein
MQITQDLLKTLFTYNAETGEFTYKKRTPSEGRGASETQRWNSRYSCKVAGFLFKEGYLGISIYGKQKLLHRMAFLYCHGYLPEVVDHKDQDVTNNRISNLRPATKSQNAMNAKTISTNSSGYKGVGFHKKTGKWRGRVMLDKKEYHVGLFETAEEAAEAANAKRAELHGEFASYK